jgi:hypothetical protein
MFPPGELAGYGAAVDAATAETEARGGLTERLFPAGLLEGVGEGDEDLLVGSEGQHKPLVRDALILMQSV